MLNAKDHLWMLKIVEEHHRSHSCTQFNQYFGKQYIAFSSVSNFEEV